MISTIRTFSIVAPLVAALAFCGCSGGETEETTTSDATADSHGHAHPSEGPHGGDLIELGNEEYHAEMTDDHATNTITFYVLDGAAKKQVAIAAEGHTLNAVIDGDPKQFPLEAVKSIDGKASQFQVVDEALLDALEEEGGSAKLNLKINGKPFVGKIEHHEH